MQGNCTYCLGELIVGWSNAGPIGCPLCSDKLNTVDLLTAAWQAKCKLVRELMHGGHRCRYCIGPYRLAISYTDLVSSFLLTHYQGVPALVFFDPLGDGTRPAKIASKLGLDEFQHSTIVACTGVYIFPTPCVAAPKLQELDEDEFGYVMEWGGNDFVSENT